MNIDWSTALCMVIIASSTIGLVFGKLDAKDFITCVGLVLSFLSGKTIGYMRGLKAGMGGK